MSENKPHMGIRKKPLVVKIREEEPVNWIPDSIVVAFSKESFHAKDVLNTIQRQTQFSHGMAKWNVFTSHGESIFQVSTGENVSNISGRTDTSIITLDNESAFNQFRNTNMHNPEYAEKYVAFVNGSYKDVNEDESKLVEKIYEDLGNVEMFVGKISLEVQEEVIDTPELE